ncbi:UNVERIFIED_CONTAM: hypothetical protein K2H54_069287 [Gekko kuhli]
MVASSPESTPDTQSQKHAKTYVEVVSGSPEKEVGVVGQSPETEVDVLDQSPDKNVDVVAQSPEKEADVVAYLAVAEMNESVSLNETRAPAPWVHTSRGNSSLELSSELPVFAINPWDIMLCISGTVIACENAIVVAIIFYTPNLRTPMFVLIGSLATADLLAGVGLILNFVFHYVIRSETISLVTVGFLVASFTASVSSLLAITVDRYLSLYNALTYYSEKTVLWFILRSLRINKLADSSKDLEALFLALCLTGYSDLTHSFAACMSGATL